MNDRHWFGQSLFPVLAFASAAAQANSYDIVDLGAYEEAWYVNADGVVAGWDETQKRGIVHRAKRWYKLSQHSAPQGIDDDGNVVGAVGAMPTYWPHLQAPVTIDLPGDAVTGYALGITKHGSAVVGWYYPSGTTDKRCFAWTQGEGSRDLGIMDGFTSCEAGAINDSGRVAGRAWYLGSYFHAFLLENGKFKDLGVLPGTSDSQAQAMNGYGTIVGMSYEDTYTYRAHAFVWKKVTGMLDLDATRTFPQSEALSISDAGEIVGWVEKRECHHAQTAARFAGGRAILLEKEVPQLDDWRLLTAMSVNASGTIVGIGTRTDRARHGFMLIPRHEDPRDAPAPSRTAEVC